MTAPSQMEILRSGRASSPSGAGPERARAPGSIPASAVSLALVAADAVCFGAILCLAEKDLPFVSWPAMAGLALMIGCLAAAALWAAGLYQPRYLVRRSELLVRLIVPWAALGLALPAAMLIMPATDGDSIVRWISYWPAGMVLVSISRLIASFQLRAWQRAGRLGTRVAVLGTGAAARRLLRTLDTSTPDGFHVVGVYDDRAAQLPALLLGYRLRGTVDDLVREGRDLGVEAVLVTESASPADSLVEMLNKLSVLSVDIHVCPPDFGLRFRDIRLDRLGGRTVLNVLRRPLGHWHRLAKTLEDRILGLMILLLIAPLMVAIAILIKIDSPGPVFFRQRRYGYDNQLFEVLKFRTMRHDQRDEKGEQLTRRNDSRITRLGRFLRRTSLDELPQFVNVLRGDMSIVGPRPHATAAKAGDVLYQDAIRYYAARHRMKPGITGWAQVSGWRGETETLEQIRQRVEHDLYYIENWSVMFDIEIILRTFLVLRGNRNAF